MIKFDYGTFGKSKASKKLVEILHELNDERLNKEIFKYLDSFFRNTSRYTGAYVLYLILQDYEKRIKKWPTICTNLVKCIMIARYRERLKNEK